MATTPLMGTWVLRAWYNETDDGERIYPLGTEASGYISYTPDGFVFVHLSAADRALFGINDPFGTSAAEDSAAMKSHITYAGTYDFQGDHVIHRVTHSSCPNWVGTEQRREVDLRGDRLRLLAEGALFQGRLVRAVVDWERATRPPVR